MRNFEMPNRGVDTNEITEYAGREPEFKSGEVLPSFDGNRVAIVDYLIDKGLYVVSRVDKPNMPLYRLRPDQLKRI